MKKRRTLREKISGPGAFPIQQLILRAEAAAAPLYERYQSFAEKQIVQVSGLLEVLEKAPSIERWQSLSAAIQDLRSSSATFGAHCLSEFAEAWERALDPKFRESEKIFAAMHIHLRSLKLAFQRELPIEKQEMVKAELDKVVRRLQS